MAANKKIARAQLEKIVRDAAADPSREIWCTDGAQQGLAVRSRKGRTSFVFHYRSPITGKRKRDLLAKVGDITLKQARDLAQKRLAKVIEGIDPKEERRQIQRDSRTVAEAVESYLKGLRISGKASSFLTIKNRLERRVLPVFGHQPLRAIDPEQVIRWHRGMMNTPADGNRALSYLGTVYRHAIALGWAERNPCDALRGKRHPERGQRKAVDSQQLEALGLVLQDAEAKKPTVVALIRFCALTGFRRIECVGHQLAARRRKGEQEWLIWSDLDLENGIVHLRDSKSGDPQRRVIGSAAIRLLRELRPKRAHASDPVFPSPLLADRPYCSPDRVRRRLYREARIEGRDLHSLRHSFASICAHVQYGRFVGVTSALLGHGHGVGRSITERYVSTDHATLRFAADAISEHIARLLGIGIRGEVVDFPEAVSR